MTAHKEGVLDRLVSYFDEEAEFSKQTEETFGDIDILVNNSGATWDPPVEEMPLEKFDLVMRVNVQGTFLMSQAVGRRMIERGGGGRIISVSSVAGLVGGHPDYMQTIGYNTSKGAVISMTRAHAVARARYNIRPDARRHSDAPFRWARGLEGRDSLPGLSRGRICDRPDARR